ncbi:MAG TPA: rod shape-determining protein [Candidatus Scybalocola faecipullorum]|nr:rod shape-determining protein [Candidatus Scybalocola faecipullorum]
MLVSDIGIDLGTASVLVYVRGRGIVVNEPSVVAYDKDTQEIQAIGEEAQMMIGRTPGNIAAIRPLSRGVISDDKAAGQMLKYFIEKALSKKHFKKPRLSICVPSGATEVEKRAVVEAAVRAGAREVQIVEEPVAGAIGAGIDISRPVGSLIVDIGGGTTDIAVISMNETVISTSVRVAGDNFDEALIRYIKKKHNMLIGKCTAEEIKKQAGCVCPFIEAKIIKVHGRNQLTGLPKTIQFTSEEAMEAFMAPAQIIVSGIRQVLERTPPELAADIARRGIVMTGGGSLLYGFDRLIENTVGIQTTIAQDPMSVVAIGTGCYAQSAAACKMGKKMPESKEM